MWSLAQLGGQTLFYIWTIWWEHEYALKELTSLKENEEIMNLFTNKLLIKSDYQ